MLEIKEKIEKEAQLALHSLYQIEVSSIELAQTRKEFEGDLTIVVFPYLRSSKKGPEQTANEIGEYLKDRLEEIEDFNVVKGFLNLLIADSYWMQQLEILNENKNFGKAPKNDDCTLVEYSSPNTNKPLHLGHIRNILLGYSVSQLLESAGHRVIKAQIINDRGIHICKSMIAWQKFGNGETPSSSGLKGDKLVGKYYVAFDKAFKNEVEGLINSGLSEKEAENQAPIMVEAREMLKKWEDNDADVMALWKTMNEWVYEGFEYTYASMGVDFDKYYYESDTYVLGKKIVEEGLNKGIFYKKEDGSVWIDLSEEGMDQKILLRSDGTSVYMTQDIGTAIQRFVDFKEEGLNGMIYTVGNEQDYHFKVLFIILEKLGYDWAKNLYHLSYGMVDLPSGKMKSREGTVVDADDLIQKMIDEAQLISEELGKTEGMDEEEKMNLYRMVGLGALKYYILRVDPKKRMLFNPKESIDFKGDTGPYIQFNHARIKSLLKKGEEGNYEGEYSKLHPSERSILKNLVLYPEMVQIAAQEHSPSIIASYIYDLVKAFSAFYQQLPILTDENSGAIAFRLKLSANVAKVIKAGMKLLGIDVPEKM